MSEGKASDLLVACLEAEGVDRVFGIPGEETLDLNRSLADSPIEFVPARHEQGAALMAAMYGRLTGRPGVCLSTLGPGATNLVSGVADAFMDHVPLVALTGQAGLARMHKESHQYIDLVRLLEPVTKWNARVSDPATVPEAVAKAFRVAQAEKPGATHLELPEDVMAAPVQGRPLAARRAPLPEASQAQVEAAAELIASARKAVILAGNGVIRAGATTPLRALAVATATGVAETFMGKGAMASDDPLWLGTVGLADSDYELAGFGDADVVIAVGYDLVEHAPSHWNADGDKRVICIDTVPAEVDAGYQPEVELVGGLASSLDRLHAALTRGTPTRPAPRSASSALSDLLVAHLAAGLEDIAFPVRPGRALADLRRIPEDAILISDVGLHKLWIARLFPTRHPRTVFIPNGLAGMGVALPMGIAAKLAHPDRPVVTVSGDGGFLMNCQELETAARLRTAVVNVVWEDQALSAIVTKQDDQFGATFGTRFGATDFVSLAKAFGVPAWRCESPADFGAHMTHALTLDEPTVVVLPVDYAVHPDVTGDPAQEALTA